MHHQIFEGTWEEVAKKASRLKANTHVRLEVVKGQKKSVKLTFGMFGKELGVITDEDYAAAEWRGPKPEGEQ
ncbi:MAG: hypothetical protein HZC36_07070 [Armatimonadetes bacterium]|jgi:hypothetical protein|nr:hypothetical protein [Armatimonadota bacterium]